MVRTYFSVFIASAICCWYLLRSRLTKAVMARILGLAGSGAVGVVVARWALAAVAKITKAKRVASARSRCRDIFGWLLRGETIHRVTRVRKRKTECSEAARGREARRKEKQIPRYARNDKSYSGARIYERVEGWENPHPLKAEGAAPKSRRAT